MILFSCFSFGLVAQSESVIDIFSAIEMGRVKVVKNWLKAHVDHLDIKNHNGQGLLHCAVACKQRKITKMLVKAGVKVNQLDQSKRTALDYAVESNQNKIACDLYKLSGKVTTTQNLDALKRIFQARAKSLLIQAACVGFIFVALAISVVIWMRLFCVGWGALLIFIILEDIIGVSALITESVLFYRAYSWSKAIKNLELYVPVDNIVS